MSSVRPFSITRAPPSRCSHFVLPVPCRSGLRFSFHLLFTAACQPKTLKGCRSLLSSLPRKTQFNPINSNRAEDQDD
ncbi:hypothetical protein L6164_019397 [Bauhinia variegata]|uniref:Uncharacterized protein n=1 Tax=Bauhinia variegata TaxID=167791 RepID=A0ACB9MRT3_BAUVA|nr:hypothetical protein L6164_019397 [Bauhinia variegata]